MNPNQKLGLRIATDLASVECNRAEELRRLLRDVIYDLTTLQANPEQTPEDVQYLKGLIAEHDAYKADYDKVAGERYALAAENQMLRDELKAIREAAGAKLLGGGDMTLAESVGWLVQRFDTMCVDVEIKDERIIELTQKLDALTPQPWVRYTASPEDQKAFPLGKYVLFIEWQQRYVRFGMFADVPYGDAVTYYRIVPTEFTNPPTVTL